MGLAKVRTWESERTPTRRGQVQGSTAGITGLALSVDSIPKVQSLDTEHDMAYQPVAVRQIMPVVHVLRITDNSPLRMSFTRCTMTAQEETDKRFEQAIEYLEKSNSERWTAHGRIHDALALAIDKADSSQRAALKAALDDHHREHSVHEAAHEREHSMNAEAVRVADTAMTARLASLNEFREQLRDQAKTFASTERVDAFMKENDRRITDTLITTQAWYENNRQRIESLEKGDVKSEGKGMGRDGAIATIVTSIAVTGGVLGIIVVLSNLLT